MVLKVRLPRLEHFAVESSCMGSVRRLVAVDGLPCMLSQRCTPALKSVAVKGLSQEPFSTERRGRSSSSVSIRQATTYCTNPILFAMYNTDHCMLTFLQPFGNLTRARMKHHHEHV